MDLSSSGVRLAQSWIYESESGNFDRHIINLYHDTFTGTRLAMINFQEVPGSEGSSTIFMVGFGHRIFFQIDEKPGYIEISKHGFTGFTYKCVINNRLVEYASAFSTTSSPQFVASVPTVIFVPIGEEKVAWYALHVSRQKDLITTIVHRRFKEFKDLETEIKDFFISKRIPPLPAKSLKMLTNHEDPAFVADRKNQLSNFIVGVANDAVVSDAAFVKAFLGFPKTANVKEISFVFYVPSLDSVLTLKASSEKRDVIIVDEIRNQLQCEGLSKGDALIKINGDSIFDLRFSDINLYINSLPRPMIFHFLASIDTAMRDDNRVSMAQLYDRPNNDDDRMASTSNPLRRRMDSNKQLTTSQVALPPAPMAPPPPLSGPPPPASPPPPLSGPPPPSLPPPAFSDPPTTSFGDNDPLSYLLGTPPPPPPPPPPLPSAPPDEVIVNMENVYLSPEAPSIPSFSPDEFENYAIIPAPPIMPPRGSHEFSDGAPTIPDFAPRDSEFYPDMPAPAVPISDLYAIHEDVVMESPPSIPIFAPHDSEVGVSPDVPTAPEYDIEDKLGEFNPEEMAPPPVPLAEDVIDTDNGENFESDDKCVILNEIDSDGGPSYRLSVNEDYQQEIICPPVPTPLIENDELLWNVNEGDNPPPMPTEHGEYVSQQKNEHSDSSDLVNGGISTRLGECVVDENGFTSIEL